MRTTRAISRPTLKSKTALTRSIASPRREAAVLRRARERLEEEPRADETSARSSVAARRTSSG
jgi:hypothetical protein